MPPRICRLLSPSPEGFHPDKPYSSSKRGFCVREVIAVWTRNIRAIGRHGGRGLVQSATVASPKTVHVRAPATSAFRPCPLPWPGRECPHPARVLKLSVSVASPHPRRVHLRLRVNRPSIVWLAARRQGSFAVMPGDFHLDDARFAGSQRAIKDSRGKCRSRWLEITQEIIPPYRGHFPASPRIGTRLVHGENADCAGSWSVRAHGKTADADAVTDWSRTACGYGHRRGHLPARLRFHRDCFADSKTSFSRGVTRACDIEWLQ